MRIVISYKKMALALIFILIAVGLGFGGYFGYTKWYKPKKITWDEEKMFSYLITEQMKDDYGTAKKAEADILQNPTDFNAYLRAGFSWKVLGESTKQDIFFDRSLDAYLGAIKQFGVQYAMPYVNAGNIYKLRGDFKTTEEMFKKALEITPGEPDLYVRLAELYRFDMKKSPEEILAIYDEGVKRCVSTMPLAISKAAYLRSVGKKEEAMELYQKIYEATKDEIYLWEIEDIQQSQ